MRVARPADKAGLPGLGKLKALGTSSPIHQDGAAARANKFALAAQAEERLLLPLRQSPFPADGAEGIPGLMRGKRRGGSRGLCRRLRWGRSRRRSGLVLHGHHLLLSEAGALPAAVRDAPALLVTCPPGDSMIIFYGLCPLEIPRDRYWDTLEYVNASVSQTSFARMYLVETKLCFTNFLKAENGRPPSNMGVMARIFAIEATTLSMGATYVTESLMKPAEAVNHAMTMMREQTHSELD
jgi:hypothetical protein